MMKISVTQIKFRKLILGLIAGFSLFQAMGCSRNDNYRYYTAPYAPAGKFDSVHKIKDIVENGNRDVDFVTIIDNSGSMAAYQSYLAANADVFITALAQSKLYWKTGIITTSVAEKPYIGFEKGDELTYKDKQAAQKFRAVVQKLGTWGDGTERTYEPVMNALTNYPNFVRSTANLFLLLISDAPEQSRTTTADFVSFLTKIKGDVRKISFYGVLDPKDECPSTDDPFYWKGNKFEELITLVGGKHYPICDSNFGTHLTDIAQTVAEQVSSPRIFLEARPKIETLTVIFHGQPLAAGPKDQGGFWIYNYRQNSVVFHDLDFAPGDLEEVQVKYDEDISTP